MTVNVLKTVISNDTKTSSSCASSKDRQSPRSGIKSSSPPLFRRSSRLSLRKFSKLSSQNSQTDPRSKNPLKKIFGRSKSHHFDVVSSANKVTPDVSRLHREPKSSTALPSMALHNSNPFNSNKRPGIERPFRLITGKYTDISNLRTLPMSSSNTSHIANPYRTLSESSQSQRSLSYYQNEGNGKQEKILPLPIKNPNEMLPDNLKQPSILLTDNFVFPTNLETERKHLGEGCSSQVVTVVSLYKKKNIYALKRFKMFSYETPDGFYDRCIKEYLIAKKLSCHINIVKTYYIMKVPSSITNGLKRSWAFVMQQCVHDMYHFTMMTGWVNKSFEEKWCCFKQICRGVKHMHSFGIAHRDIKLENVLTTDYGALKLTDFGISTYAIEDPDNIESSRIKLRGYCGSPPHVPPEVMILSHEKRRKTPVPKDKDEYDPFKMDMWALGIVMYNLIISVPMFTEAHKDDNRYRHYLQFYHQYRRYSPQFLTRGVYKSGPGAEHPEFSKFQSVEATRVCLRLLDPDPETRYTIEDLFNDPWMNSVETCIDEDDEEPLRVPELKKTTEGADSPFAHDICPSEEELSPTSNPFLEKTKYKTKLMSFIADGTPSPKSSPKLGTNETLPTLNEENSKDCGHNYAHPSSSQIDILSERPICASYIATKKISSLSLNDHDNNGNMIHSITNSASISRSSSIVSRNSSMMYSISNGNTSSPIIRKKKRMIHRHHECSGKSLPGTR